MGMPSVMVSTSIQHGAAKPEKGKYNFETGSEHAFVYLTRRKIEQDWVLL